MAVHFVQATPMEQARALRIHRDDQGTQARIEAWTSPEPGPGEVRIRAQWSSLNYKDALAVTGKGKILRQFPLTAGIDVAGVVEASRTEGLSEGDAVLVTGYGLSETRDGGLSNTVTVPGACVVALPMGLSPREAMAYGTAGFTAGLAMSRLLDNGQRPELGPVAVTGATGGVGSYAIAILSQLGYDVHALSRKSDATDYLRGLGASEVHAPDALPIGERPLESGRYGGVIDNVGGALLSRLLRAVVEYGNVASIGLAGGVKLDMTVLPFILRGVSVVGVHSVECPMPRRLDVWGHLASDWKPAVMDRIVTREVALDEVPAVCEDMIAGAQTGRTVVRLAD